MQPIDRLYQSAARHPQAIAVAGIGDAAITYAELCARVDAFAAALQRMDSAVGSRVGICAWNTTEHLLAVLATYAAGKVWVPLNPRNGRTDLDAMIAATGPSIIVADDSCVDRFTPTDARFVTATDVRRIITDERGAAPVRIERGGEDPQIIKFSGGSTAAPKPVVQSIRCVNAQADGLRDFFEFTSDDVNLIAAPLTHGASCFVLPILETGGRHVLLADAKPQAILERITTHGVTTMYAPPTLLYGLIEDANDRLPGVESLRHVIYSAAPMAPEMIRKCQRALGPVIETAYGQVEAPQIIAAMRADEMLLDANLTSVGRASSVAAIRIKEETGEILVRGPLLMSGYLDRPEETASTLVDGWLHTGDVGTIDDRGYLFIQGRLREVINTGGFKVFPGDVEASLLNHPDVLECAVFGVEDPKWGEAVGAAVVLRTSVGADELIRFVKAELGSVKAPKRIWFVDHLERNAAGKVSRGAVRKTVTTDRAQS